MKVPEHEHPLILVKLHSELEEYEEEYGEDGDLIISQDFHSKCDRCHKEINWFHKYYYKCPHACSYSLHRYCVEVPTKLYNKYHIAHALFLLLEAKRVWQCDRCLSSHQPEEPRYGCSKCNYYIDICCVMETEEHHIIHHPSHPHPLVPLPKEISGRCDACCRRHEGFFYHCTSCFGLFINRDCAFMPKKKLIQVTKYDKSHPHPLTLSYSFQEDRKVMSHPICRVCLRHFDDDNNWFYKCHRCRYYVHLRCPPLTRWDLRYRLKDGQISYAGAEHVDKNYKPSDYPNLLHLPFLDESDNVVKHVFSKDTTFETDDKNLEHNFHQHPLTLVRTEYNDIASPSSSRTKNQLSCHNPMKKIEVLCNGCVRPITSMPFYKCNDQNCNFVLHEWCVHLPRQLKTRFCDHRFVLYPNVPHDRFSSVFYCKVCLLPCNGCFYRCDLCRFEVDVSCAFIPKEITHEAHPGHLLSMVPAWQFAVCFLCQQDASYTFSFRCHTCSKFAHITCALLLPRTIRHKKDKHSMTLSYLPIENHKSEYFCEICEEEMRDLSRCFYHCYPCEQSVHPACAPSILQSETAVSSYNNHVHEYVNIKFGGIHIIERHPHPLTFVQGIKTDGLCTECHKSLHYKMIFKCRPCKYAIDFRCCERFSDPPISHFLQ